MYIVRDPRTVLDAVNARDVEAVRLERCDHHFLGSYLIIRARRARTAVERRLGRVAVVRPDPGLEAGDGLDPARGKAVTCAARARHSPVIAQAFPHEPRAEEGHLRINLGAGQIEPVDRQVPEDTPLLFTIEAITNPRHGLGREGAHHAMQLSPRDIPIEQRDEFEAHF